MAVDAKQLHNALQMSINDYCSNEDNILRDELNDIKNRFSNLIDVSLKKEANEVDEEE